MSVEDNKALLRRHYQEIWSAGDLDTILQRVAETVAADYIDHNPTPGQAPGLAGLKQLLRGLHTAFPDMQTTVENLVAEGDQVVAYWRFRGTNTGPLAFMGLPATGRPVEMTGMDMVRVANGKIVEWWHIEDTMNMVRQLGAGPAQD